MISKRQNFQELLSSYVQSPKRRRYALGRTADWMTDSRSRNAVTEIGVTSDFLEASGIAPFVKKHSLKNLNIDRPDVAFEWRSGGTVGVEVAELVSSEWLKGTKQAAQGSPEYIALNYKIYDEEAYVSALAELLNKKLEKPQWSKSFDEKWLLIHTGEPDLQFRKDGLARVLGMKQKRFSRVFILGARVPCADPDTDDGTAWGELTFSEARA